MGYRRVYKKALKDAVAYLEGEPDLEPTSALKQAGADNGIPYGSEMEKFVEWASRKLRMARAGSRVDVAEALVRIAGDLLGPGVPDGTGPARGTGECPFDDEDFDEDDVGEAEVVARDRRASRWAVDLVNEVETALNEFYVEVGPALDQYDLRTLKRVDGHVEAIRKRLEYLYKIMDRADI